MCLRVATSGGDELAVLNCYYIKVRCLFKFTALAVAAHYSLHAASVMVESPALLAASARPARRLSCALVTLDCSSRSCRKCWMRCVGREELGCLSSSLSTSHLPLSKTSTGLALLSHITHCLSSLSVSQSYQHHHPQPQV